MQGVWNLNYSNMLTNTINMYLTNFQKKNSILLNVLIPFFMNSDGIWGTFISHHCTDNRYMLQQRMTEFSLIA